MHLDVRLEHEGIWLTQARMAELFGRERSVTTRHIQRALADDELSPESNVQKTHIASSDKPKQGGGRCCVLCLDFARKSK